MTTATEFLEHFGVKGMKWGRRTVSVPSTQSTKNAANNTTSVKKPSKDKPKVLRKSSYSSDKAKVLGLIAGTAGAMLVSDIAVRRAFQE